MAPKRRPGAESSQERGSGSQDDPALRAAAIAEAQARALGARLAAAEAERVALELERIVRELEGGPLTPEGTPRSTEATEFPPYPSQSGNRWWFAREYPELEDGILTAKGLQNEGVDPEVPRARGSLLGFKTSDPTLRRAKETGVRTSVVHWY